MFCFNFLVSGRRPGEQKLALGYVGQALEAHGQEQQRQERQAILRQLEVGGIGDHAEVDEHLLFIIIIT